MNEHLLEIVVARTRNTPKTLTLGYRTHYENGQLCLWILREVLAPFQEFSAGQVFIDLDVFDDGYIKEFTESQNPPFYTCPDVFLDLANAGICQEWRTLVKERNRQELIL